MSCPPCPQYVVIGVGHRDRADDGIGPAVVDALGHRTEEVTTLVREGDLAVLPLLWSTDDDVVVVDALAGTGAVGELVELDPTDLAGGVGLSTHGMNVADAIELARRLDCMPARLRVFGVTGRDFGYGTMSRALHHRVEPLVDELMAKLGCAPDVGDARAS